MWEGTCQKLKLYSREEPTTVKFWQIKCENTVMEDPQKRTGETSERGKKKKK